MMLDPSLAILDETDSGLDVDAFKIVADTINSRRSKDNSMLIITHYQRLLERIRPDVVHIFINGSIVQSGGPELANEIEKNGFEGFANVG